MDPKSVAGKLQFSGGTVLDVYTIRGEGLTKVKRFNLKFKYITTHKTVNLKLFF